MAVEIITSTQLASYLRDPTLSGNESLILYVSLANGLVGEIVGADLAPIPARVTTITLEVAARAWRNPDGYASETVQGEYTYRRDPQTRSAGVYVTDPERDELLRITGAVAGTAYSVTVSSPLDAP